MNFTINHIRSLKVDNFNRVLNKILRGFTILFYIQSYLKSNLLQLLIKNKKLYIAV